MLLDRKGENYEIVSDVTELSFTREIRFRHAQIKDRGRYVCRVKSRPEPSLEADHLAHPVERNPAEINRNPEGSYFYNQRYVAPTANCLLKGVHFKTGGKIGVFKALKGRGFLGSYCYV